MRRLEGVPLSTLIRMQLDIGEPLSASWLRQFNRELLEEYSDTEIDAALKIIAAGDGEAPTPEEQPAETGEQLGAEERHLRKPRSSRSSARAWPIPSS